MSHVYVATVTWERGGAAFTDNKYPRAHQWRFDGGAVVAASASPSIVPPPLSDAAGVDPEEAFVASLSSCHMLWALSHAAKRGWIVERYEDEASGTMGRNAEGRIAMLKVVLRPKITWGGTAPGAAEIGALHAQAHHDCFIANSVKTVVVVEPR